MPRSTTVPIYTTTAVSGGANQRTLSTTSPGTTDSTATQHTGGITGDHAFLTPEAQSTKITGSGTTAPSPATIDKAYSIDVLAVLAPTASALTFAAGTWTLPLHYSRAGGVLTADVPSKITLILVRTDSGQANNLSEIGRTEQAITATTTEQSINVNITGAQTTFNAGQRMSLLVYIDRPGAPTSDTTRIHTNSTTALRISAAPTFTLDYTRSISDSPAMTDALARAAAYGRLLSDTPAVADTLARRVDRFRALSDSAPMTDALTRQVASSRALNDSAPMVDSLERAATYSRQINDSSAVTESLGRQVGYARALQENLSSGGGTTIVTPVFGTFE